MYSISQGAWMSLSQGYFQSHALSGLLCETIHVDLRCSRRVDSIWTGVLLGKHMIHQWILGISHFQTWRSSAFSLASLSLSVTFRCAGRSWRLQETLIRLTNGFNNCTRFTQIGRRRDLWSPCYKAFEDHLRVFWEYQLWYFFLLRLMNFWSDQDHRPSSAPSPKLPHLSEKISGLVAWVRSGSNELWGILR